MIFSKQGSLTWSNNGDVNEITKFRFFQFKENATIFCRSSSHIFSRMQESLLMIVSGAFSCSAEAAPQQFFRR